MKTQDINAQIEAFFQSGGKVKQCSEGDTAIRQVPRNLYRCESGCHGDFTEHSMRAGESGRCFVLLLALRLRDLLRQSSRNRTEFCSGN